MTLVVKAFGIPQLLPKSRVCGLACLLWTGATHAQTAAVQLESEDRTEDRTGMLNAAPVLGAPDAFIRPIIAPQPTSREPWLKPGQAHGVDWGGLTMQSGLFLGLQHGFRLWTEQGTREGMKGPFFKGWKDAATNLNGWADGDEFYVNYVGHPIQGAASAFIWVQNDRSYREAEFGKSAVYWKSRMRAAAFAAAYSAQFELGPLSEASIGNVQAFHPQQGLVDAVITPVLGTAWMILEDALDQYVIKRFERNVDNPYLQVLVRGWLNPARSWANMMRLKVPWVRDTRPDIFTRQVTAYLKAEKGARMQGPPKQLLKEREGQFGVAPVEFSVEARPQVYVGGSAATPCMGGGADLAIRMTRNVQLAADIAGCKMIGLETNLSGDTLSYLIGPRWTPRPSSRWSPYAHILFGGTRVTEERMYPALKAALIESAKRQGKEPPVHDDYTTKYQSDGFSLSAGTGLDLRVNPALAVRLASVEYRRSWLPLMNGRNFENGLVFRTSVVLRVGTW